MGRWPVQCLNYVLNRCLDMVGWLANKTNLWGLSWNIFEQDWKLHVQRCKYSHLKISMVSYCCLNGFRTTIRIHLQTCIYIVYLNIRYKTKCSWLTSKNPLPCHPLHPCLIKPPSSFSTLPLHIYILGGNYSCAPIMHRWRLGEQSNKNILQILKMRQILPEH
jgi:hypothetical protein